MAEPVASLDVFPLERIGTLHGIAAELFVPFVIQRLSRSPQDQSRDLDIELVGVGGVAHDARQLRITWELESILELPAGVQQNVVTEWAALGIAAAVVWQYAGLRIETVAEVGSGFDFWVNDGRRTAGLEVSGTYAADLSGRRRQKAQQLVGNPHGVDGYVAVVRFDRAAASVSFHRFSEVVS